MAGFYILLCIFLLLLLIITETVETRIVKDETLNIEIHFVFLALCFRKREGRESVRLSARFYSRLFKRLSSLSRVSEIYVNSVLIPTDKSDLDGAFTRPYRYTTAISAALAHLSSNAKKILLPDNVFTLVPDEGKPLSFSVTLKARLFYLIRTLLAILIDVKRTKKRKRENKNVGN